MSKIGLLSDSHGRATTTRRAVECLLEQDVDRLIHLGDVGSLEVIDCLVVENGGGRVPTHLVFGNVDWDYGGMADYARDLEISVDHPAGEIEVDGRRIGFLHGHESRLVESLVDDGVDYLCHGHSHRQRDEKQDGTRFVNPGALFRAHAYSVAVLDPAADTVEFFDVPAQAFGQ